MKLFRIRDTGRPVIACRIFDLDEEGIERFHTSAEEAIR